MDHDVDPEVVLCVERYKAAMQRVQNAIAYRIEQSGITEASTRRMLKHHRVGIDGSKAEHLALVTLLSSKGIITELEYAEALAVAAEMEASEQASWTRAQFNLPDTVSFG